jgi:hypothetical protein
MVLLIAVAVAVLIALLIPRLLTGNKPKTESSVQTKRRIPFSWQWFHLREQRKTGTAFYIADDASTSAYLDTVWGLRRPGEVWMVLGQSAQGARRLLNRLVIGLGTTAPSVYYLSAGIPPKHDEFWALPAQGNWNIWGHGMPDGPADVNRYDLAPLWFDQRVHPNRLWLSLRVWAATSGNAWQSPRMETLADLLAYSEALWPLMCECRTAKVAYQECTNLFDLDRDANLLQLRAYLEKVGCSGGDWPARITRTLGNRQSVETLGLLWQFLKRWAEIDDKKTVPLGDQQRWLWIFPEHFAAGASFALELLLASSSPGLVILDRLGEQLPPELYLEQVERLKRNGWTVLLSESHLGWLERGDEGESRRIGSLVDNWLFGRLDGASAAIVESALGLEQEVNRISVSRSFGLSRTGSNSATTAPSIEALLPVRTLTNLPFNQAVICWRIQPSWEPNRLRFLSLNS